MFIFDFNGMDEYTAKFRRLLSELKYIDPELSFANSAEIHWFLAGLGPTFSNFRSTFNQTHHIIGAGATTFDTTVREAANEERLS